MGDSGKNKAIINRIVKTLIWSDFLMLSAGGFLAPIYAVFVTGQVTGGTLATVGFATTVFYVVKSLVQFPVSWYADRHKGERDDFLLVVVGSVIAAVVPLLYYFLADAIWQVYLFEAINGVGYALLTPTWLAIFSRHLDKERESTEWTLHSNAIGFGFAAAAAAGGLLAERFGFGIIFLLVSGCTFAGAAVLLAVKSDILESDRRNGFPPLDDRKIKTLLPN
jgi:MFS family permease